MVVASGWRSPLARKTNIFWRSNFVISVRQGRSFGEQILTYVSHHYMHILVQIPIHSCNLGFSGSSTVVCLTASFPREHEKLSSFKKVDVSIFEINSNEKKLELANRANQHTT